MDETRRSTRRTFLGASLAGAGLFGLEHLRGRRPLLAGSGHREPGAPVLVVLQLSGGNDGLNTVVPYEDPEYARVRGGLAIAGKDVHPLGRGVGLHPSLAGLAELHAAGRLAVVQGVGYPGPNRSHFKSMDIWHSADPSAADIRFGWLGRAADLAGASDADLAVNFSANVPLALNGRICKPISFEDPSRYRYVGAEKVVDTFEKMAAGAGARQNPALDRLRRTAQEAVSTSDAIRKATLAYRSPVAYPRTPIGNSLRNTAALLAAGLSTRFFYTYHGGFDTHVNQAPRHANLLQQLDQAAVAFQKDLERTGIADRVVLLAFSEFGRRVRPNASGGTDHGVAGPVLLVGSRVRAGVHGEHPSLTELVKGDLGHTVDFRRVYATVLDRWLNLDSRAVLGGSHEPLPLFG